MTYSIESRVLINLQQINKLFTCHKKLVVLVKQVDHTNGLMLADAYYCGTLLTQFLIYTASKCNAPFMLRLLCGSAACTGIFMCYGFTFISARIWYQAHRPYNYLSSLMVKNITHRHKTPRINFGEVKRLKQKFQVLLFIERLGGPTIGIYCIDLFPFTNYEFYQYVIASSSLYILLLGILKDF